MSDETQRYAAALTACCLVALGGYVGSFVRIPVLPLHARSLGIGTAEIGWINGAFFLTAGVLSLPLGRLADRVGHRRVAAAGLLVMGVASFVLCMGGCAAHFAASYVALGLGVALFGPTMMALVALITPRTHLGRAYGWYTTALYVGMSLGPALGGALARRWGAVAAFATAGGVLFAVFVLAWLRLPRGHPAGEHSSEPGRIVGVGAVFRNRRVLAGWLATSGGCFGLGMFLTYFPLHARARGLDVAEVGLLFLVQGLCNAGSRIPMGAWSDRVSNRGVLVLVGLCGYAAAMVGLGVSSSLWPFLVGAAALGVSMGLAFTSIGALVAESSPPDLRGLAMGGYNASIFFGMMLNAVIMGGVAERIGFAGAFVATGMVNLAAAGGFLALLRGSSTAVPASTP